MCGKNIISCFWSQVKTDSYKSWKSDPNDVFLAVQKKLAATWSEAQIMQWMRKKLKSKFLNHFD
jgi:hypothetical protein